MRINHNISALNTYNKLSANTTATSKSLEKLSSGLKINRAGDDAAGLAISEKMRSQIRGLDTASRNANDGISLIQTAEGALSETHSILQRMRELAVQSSNDTNTTDDRAEMQKEIDQLTAEIDRIGNTTEFNTKKLLNGGAGITTSFSAETVAAVDQNWISVVGGTSDTTADNTDIVITAATKATQATATLTVGGTATTTAAPHTVTINGYTVSFTGSIVEDDAAAAALAAINAVSEKTGVVASYDTGTDAFTLTSNDVGSAAEIIWSADAGALDSVATGSTVKGADATVTSATIGAYTASGNTITVTGGKYEGLELKVNKEVASSTAADNDATFKITGNGSLALQIGANEGQEMGITIQDMRAEALGVNALDVTTQTTAKAALTTLDDAIKTVSSERAKLGGYQNRLEHTINNLGTTSENLSASESRIRDVDMAKEMMEFTKNNILSQAAQAMLAQANQQPQSVLQLLQ